MTLEHVDTIISFAAVLAGVSLLVTTLTQTASALLSLRGANLRWGIATLLKQADPDLATHALTIAEQVLRHPVISDSSVSGFESTFFGRWKLASAIRKDDLIRILRDLPNQTAKPAPGSPSAEWAVALNNSLDQIDPGVAQKLLQMAPAIKLALAGDAAKADQIISQLTSSAERLTGNIDKWFDTVMDSVSQRFTTHARIWTVIFSTLVAFALHMDAFRLLTQLSTDSELRARLAASAEALTKKADESHLSTTNEAPATDAAALKQLTKAANEVQSILSDKLTFELMPDPYPKPFYNYWTPSWSHFWGIVTSAALLSLGAPFWFNMLKTLSDLQPALAQKQEAEASAKLNA